MELPSNCVLLSFEGPDRYSMVGGLGTRVVEMSAALAGAGVRTTLVFVGDPHRPPVEQAAANLEYRRWCQWISLHHPGGVYDGEWGKSADFGRSVPPFVAEEIVVPAARRGERALVIAEDWQTVPALLELDRTLRRLGRRDAAELVWNANNVYGFHTINWSALRDAARITTVSRYMKFELQTRGVEAMVIPNGIPERLLEGPPEELVRVAEDALRHRPLFVKVGRFDGDKRWLQAIDAVAQLAAGHPRTTLIARGDGSAYGNAILARAGERGLTVGDVSVPSREPEALLRALATTAGSVLNVRSFIPEELLFTLYHVADGVLANSGHEPFGLVGLEVMAAGGVAVTGSTGEEYAQPFENAIVCDTGDSRELAAYLEALVADPSLSRRIRAAGHATAERYTWPIMLDVLARKLSF